MTPPPAQDQPQPEFNPEPDYRRRQSDLAPFYAVYIAGFFGLLLIGGLAVCVWLFLIRDADDRKPLAVTDKGETPRTAEPVTAKPKAITRPDPKKRDALPAWFLEAEKELKVTREIEARNPRIVEPVRPALMTEFEYRNAIANKASFQLDFNVREPSRRPEIVLRTIEQRSTAQVMPETVRVIRREAFVQSAFNYSDSMLDARVNGVPELRSLLDPEFRKTMRSRLPWNERKSLHSKFAAMVGDKEAWSLLHPFDDLNGEEMTAAVAAAEKAVARGINVLSADERRAILLAGGSLYLEKLLGDFSALLKTENR